MATIMMGRSQKTPLLVAVVGFVAVAVLISVADSDAAAADKLKGAIAKGIAATTPAATALAGAAASKEPNKLDGNAKPELIYFPFKGTAEASRLAFFIGNIDFEDTRISVEEFISKRDSYPFEQLPVLRLGDSMVVQSNAILFYAGRRANLVPKDPEGEVLVLQILEIIEDIVMEDILPAYLQRERQKEKDMVAELTNVLPAKFRKFNEIVNNFGDAAGHSVGNTMTIADLGIYVTMDWLRTEGAQLGIPSGVWDSNKQLLEVERVVGQHPRVMEWNAKHN